MGFVPDYSGWIRERMEQVPSRVASFCGTFSDQQVLDLGCGDMIMDVGLLSLNPVHITGLDVHRRSFDVAEHAVNEVKRQGHTVPDDARNRLSYSAYGGRRFPFPDHSFDVVFSWGAFEHIRHVDLALSEVGRVLKPTGKVFIDVYPWFYSYLGSHLADFIPEPFFHLRRSNRWVRSKLKRYISEHPEQATQHLPFWRPEGYSFRDFVLEHMYGEYRTLNRFSARRFLSLVLQKGWIIERLESVLFDHEAARRVPGVPYGDLITVGTTMLLKPGIVHQAPGTFRSVLRRLSPVAP